MKSSFSIRPDAYGGYWVTVRVSLEELDRLTKWYNDKLIMCENDVCEVNKDPKNGCSS